MHQWIVKETRDGRLAGRQHQDVWTWTVIGIVAVLTLLVVWVPLLIAALHT